MKLALAACLVAAVAYGVGAVMQALGARRAGLSTAGHDAHQAGTPGQADAGRDLHEAGGIGTLLRQPIFLIGLLVDFAAWSISRYALHTLPLFAVQTTLAGSLAITVILAKIVLGTDVRTRDKWAIMATIGGLVLVGVSAGEETASMLSRDVKFGIVLGVPVLALVGAVAKRMRHSIALASLAGLAFTASALAARAVRIRGQSVAHILTSPLAWAVLLYALLALWLHAVALIGGSVGPVTAAMWSTEVVIAAIAGRLVLGDHSRPGWELAAIGGILVTLAATVVLATAPAQDLEHRELAPLLDPLLDAMPDPAPDPTFGPAPDPDD